MPSASNHVAPHKQKTDSRKRMAKSKDKRAFGEGIAAEVERAA